MRIGKKREGGKRYFTEIEIWRRQRWADMKGQGIKQRQRRRRKKGVMQKSKPEVARDKGTLKGEIEKDRGVCIIRVLNGMFNRDMQIRQWWLFSFYT